MAGYRSIRAEDLVTGSKKFSIKFYIVLTPDVCGRRCEWGNYIAHRLIADLVCIDPRGQARVWASFRDSNNIAVYQLRRSDSGELSEGQIVQAAQVLQDVGLRLLLLLPPTRFTWFASQRKTHSLAPADVYRAPGPRRVTFRLPETD